MTLRVAVDATPIPGRRVGAGVYVTELLRALDRLDVELHVFVNRRDADEFASLLPRTTLHPVSIPNRVARLAWAHAVLPRRVRRIRPDVFHGPHYTLPKGLPCPGVVTFHDPTFFTLPELHERSKVAYFTRAARSGIDRAARIIAPSAYAKRGAISHAGADADVVDVIFEGVDLTRYSPDASADARLPYEPFVLFLGALEPRKNVPTLIGAYEELVCAGSKHQLVLAGPRAWGAADVDAAVQRLRAGSAHQLSYVPEAEKIRLYRRASLFVYPSTAEGFGLPVLEAMACGTPVVTTTGSAPEEIAGDAALLVPPRDQTALREAMSLAMSDASVTDRLRRGGPQRAQAYTWERAAERTLEVYERAAGG